MSSLSDLSRRLARLERTAPTPDLPVIIVRSQDDTDKSVIVLGMNGTVPDTVRAELEAEGFTVRRAP